MEGLSRSLLLFLLLCLVNTAHANTPPSIDVTTYTICVDIPADGYAFIISASDLENDPLNFTLTGINAENFTVEENTGIVRVRRPLDRQLVELDLVVVVSDGTTSDSKDILMKFIATNRHEPKFEDVPHYYNFPENTTVGSSLFTVNATDEDTGDAGRIKYRIDKVVPSSGSRLFTIDMSSGEVRLTRSLDFRLSQSYKLTIKATDGGGKCYTTTYFSSVTVADITVEDVPDRDPEFTGHPPYRVDVDEHSQVNMTVVQVTAIDPDKGINAEISYNIEDSTVDGLFQISAEGFISVQSDIDREALVSDTVILTVKATESVLNTDGVYANTTTSVVINIIDINDNPPRFYMCGSTCVEESHYTIEVLENSLGSISINMTVEDLDKDTKTNLTLGGADKDVFGVEPQFTVSEQAVQLVVIQSQNLDYETTQLMIVKVIATDQDNESLQSTATVTVHIKDANDNPKFPEPLYKCNVSEHSPNGTLEELITATDEDEPGTENSQIVYKIETSSYSNLFTIDPDTGVLKSSGEIDREALDKTLDGRIEINVTATDKGVPPLSTTVPVIIDVYDINDHKPQFGKPSYEFSVKEGEKGAFVGSVTAEDLDQTEDFNRITFSIFNESFGSFIIRSLPMEQGYIGNITVGSEDELDYETHKTITFQVNATDPDEKSAEVTVVVNVVDVNDERPEFSPIDPVLVKENTSFIAPVGRFVARDNDTIHRLVYELESMTCRCGGSMTPCSYFILLPTGEVTLNHELTVDYEECDQVLIEAQVVDELTEKGENNSATTGKMVINIEDINDNAPKFPSSDAVFVVVPEQTTKETSVANVTATDQDSGINARIEFRVTEVQFIDSNNQTHNMSVHLFKAVTEQQRDDCVGTILTTERLDQTLKGTYWVTVAAADTGACSLSATTVLKIITADGVNKVHLEFSSSVDEVKENLDNITRVLRAATNATIEIVSITQSTTSEDKTIIIARFVNSEGMTLTADEVEEMISDPEYSSELEELGLEDVGGGSSEPPDQTMAAVVAVPGFVAVIVVVGVFIKKKKREERQNQNLIDQRRDSNRSQGFITTF